MDYKSDKLIKNVVYKDIDIAYPCYITNYEIREIQDFNKIYTVVFFQKIYNNVRKLKIKIKSISASGDILQDAIYLIEDINTKSSTFYEQLAIDQSATKLEISIIESILINGNVISNKESNIINEKPVVINDKKHLKIAKTIKPNLVNYAKDFGDFWYCACGALNHKDNLNCISCNINKQTVLNKINNDALEKAYEENLQASYLATVKHFNCANSLNEYKKVFSEFKKFGDYKDCQDYLKKCNEKIEGYQKKLNRKNCIIAISLVLGVFIIILFSIVSSIIKDNKYKEIINCYKSGDLNSAYEIIETMNDFKMDKIINEGITEIKVQDNVTKIKDNTFAGMSTLENIEIPSSVTNIGKGTLYGCTSLKSVTLPFVGESNNASKGYNEVLGYIFGYSVTSFKNRVEGTVEQYYEGDDYYCYYIPKSLETVNLLSAKAIGDHAFYDCEFIASITIPNGVTNIGDHAFYNCDVLKSIDIPSSVISIEDSAFSCCASLKTVNFANDSKLSSIGEYVFSWCESLEIINLGVNNQLHSIGDKAFIWCESLTSIEIPNSVTSIYWGAFRYCSSLESIVIPNSVTSIGSDAFSDCRSLNTVYYGGTASDWGNITIDSNNQNLTNATIYYYSESQPTTAGNYWRYVNGVPTIWE